MTIRSSLTTSTIALATLTASLVLFSANGAVLAGGGTNVRDHRGQNGNGQGGVWVSPNGKPRYCGKIANADPACRNNPRDHR